MKTSYSEHKNLLIKAKDDRGASRKVRLRLIALHLIDVIAFGLKQNLLGSDINMEFLILSCRVHLIRLADLANYYASGLRLD